MKTTTKQSGTEGTKGKRITQRYISIRNEGDEIYCENVPKEDTMQSNVGSARKKLRLIRTAMPNGTWSATIEQEIREKVRHGHEAYFECLDAETLEFGTSDVRMVN